MYNFEEETLTRFFEAARERQRIYEKRQRGEPAPWTKDPAFQEFFFCNLYREQDRTTQAFKLQMRNVMHNVPEVLLATVAWRWFNKAETGIALCDPSVGMLMGKWNPVAAKELILKLRGKGPYVTGAFVIKTPNGMNKLDGVLQCISWFAERNWRETAQQMMDYGWSLKGAHDWLTQSPYLGDFMAYEIVTDLRYTALLRDAPDINSWANPGPGAMRGLCRLMGEPLDSRSRSNKGDYRWAISAMGELLQEAWRRPEISDIPRWEMREVEHWLCEFDKYERAYSGGDEGRMKRVYKAR
jgi:hypothetical protein